MKSWIDISAAHLRANFTALQQASGPETHVLPVIKANAYGHSAALCAPVLVEAGARWLGVADVEEGTHVRHALAQAGLGERPTRILVMCGFEPEDAPGLVAYDLNPVIWTLAHLDALETAAAAAGQRLRVHIEVDTGMARQGVLPGPALDTLLARFRTSAWVRLEGLFSHLSSSEVHASPQTAVQSARFEQAARQLRPTPNPATWLHPEYIHLQNTSAVDDGLLTDPRAPAWTLYNCARMIRPGLALYGYALPLIGSPAPETHLSSHLHPVATWKTRITGLRDLHPGDTVGYGATFTAPTTLRAALLPVGYADGFRREASSGLGNGWVIINGQKAPVLGRVSMNLTVVDITAHTPQPTLGDEVTLLGPGVTAHDHAHWCNTLPYEILCGMRGHHRLV